MKEIHRPQSADSLLDRTCPPPLKEVGEFVLPRPEKRMLANGMPLYVIDAGDQEVCRLDVIFHAGRYDEEKRCVADLTASMLKEGAAGFSSAQIAERLDSYGAWMTSSSMYHHSRIALYSLNRCFRETWGLLAALVWEPSFPEKELRVLVDCRKQRLFVEQAKVQYLAAKAFYAQLFGPAHPYGCSSQVEDYDRITRDDLIRWHRLRYTPENAVLVLSGKVSESMFSELEQLFGSLPFGTPATPTSVFPLTPAADREVWLEKADALQSAVRIGCPIVGQDHPDFAGLRVLNTLFGGYFGSRLMTSLREEKGYTYGIHSAIIGLQQAACLSVSAQTDIRHTRPLIDGVFAEIDRLRREPVEEEELCIVRSYLSGEFARFSDSPFSLADTVISLLLGKRPFDYFDRQAAAVRDVTSETLLHLARKYLHPDAFYTAVAGGIRTLEDNAVQ